MCHAFLTDSSVFDLLQRIDDDLAHATQAAGCPYCGGPLHRACYPRKPRGIPRDVLGAGYERRWSFCCAREGCRRRVTPASVRFLGRRVYLAVLVVVGSTRCEPALSIPARTRCRWRRWWRGDFRRTRYWTQARGRLATPIDPGRLPQALVTAFGPPSARTVVAVLRFIAPVTTRPGNTLLEG